MPLTMALFVVMASLMVISIAGCGQPRQPGLNTSQTIGANAEIGPIKLRNVFVEPPVDGDLQPGDDAVVRLAVFNDAPHPDALIGVQSEVASRLTMLWDRGCDGSFEPVSEIPLLADGTVPGAQASQADLLSAFYLQVDGVTARIWEGTTLPIRFTFAKAGSVTVEAMVVARGWRVDVPPRGCVGTVSRAPAEG